MLVQVLQNCSTSIAVYLQAKSFNNLSIHSYTSYQVVMPSQFRCAHADSSFTFQRTASESRSEFPTLPFVSLVYNILIKLNLFNGYNFNFFSILSFNVKWSLLVSVYCINYAIMGAFNFNIVYLIFYFMQLCYISSYFFW